MTTVGTRGFNRRPPTHPLTARLPILPPSPHLPSGRLVIATNSLSPSRSCGVHALLPIHPLLLDTFPFASTATFASSILFCPRSTILGRDGDRGYHWSPDQAEAVDAGEQGGCIQYAIIQSHVRRVQTHVRITQLFPLKIAINPNTLRRVMPVEVSDRSSFSLSSLSAYHWPCRVHFWFLRVRRYRDHLPDQGRPIYGRTVLQPGREAIGQQLGAA